MEKFLPLSLEPLLKEDILNLLAQFQHQVLLQISHLFHQFQQFHQPQERQSSQYHHHQSKTNQHTQLRMEQQSLTNWSQLTVYVL
jgi:hypothetical protein